MLDHFFDTRISSDWTMNSLSIILSRPSTIRVGHYLCPLNGLWRFWLNEGEFFARLSLWDIPSRVLGEQVSLICTFWEVVCLNWTQIFSLTRWPEINWHWLPPTVPHLHPFCGIRIGPCHYEGIALVEVVTSTLWYNSTREFSAPDLLL